MGPVCIQFLHPTHCQARIHGHGARLLHESCDFQASTSLSSSLPLQHKDRCSYSSNKKANIKRANNYAKSKRQTDAPKRIGENCPLESSKRLLKKAIVVRTLTCQSLGLQRTYMAASIRQFLRSLTKHSAGLIVWRRSLSKANHN